MLCFVAAKLPDDREHESSSEVATTQPTVLMQALSFLDCLSADAPEWFVDVPEFLSSASNILDRKRHERDSVAAVRGLNAIIANLSQYSGLLDYLELDLSQWATPAGLSPQVAQVRDSLTDFSGLLRGYDPVSKMESSFSETQRLRDEHDAVTRSLNSNLHWMKRCHRGLLCLKPQSSCHHTTRYTSTNKNRIGWRGFSI